MQLDAILTKERTKANVDGVSKKRVLESLATLFADNLDGVDVDELYRNLLNREKLGTTGIGSGIAIPHCRFNTQGQTYGACLTLTSPIDFDAVDSKPVDIVFAMLVPENAETEHLQLLATLAEQLQAPNFVSRLRAAHDDNKLFSAMTGA